MFTADNKGAGSGRPGSFVVVVVVGGGGGGGGGGGVGHHSWPMVQKKTDVSIYMYTYFLLLSECCNVPS